MKNDIKKLNGAEMRELKVNAFHFISVADLGFYGFTNQIIELMQEFEIFPQMYLINNKVSVIKTEVFKVVETLLLANMSIYRDVARFDQAQEDLAEMLVNDSVKLDPATLQPLEDGKSLAETLKSENATAEDI